MTSATLKDEAASHFADPEPKKTTSSVHDILAEKPPFGSRFLTADKDIWSKNAWDHVPPPDDQHERTASSLARQHAKPVPDHEKTKYNEKPAKFWDNFYKMNAENFFRDRKWLHTEFAELVAATHPDAGPVTIAELGCGVGNSVFPLLSANKNPGLQIYAFDYSSQAVKLVQRNELYTSPPLGSIQASVWDLTSDSLPEGIEPSSIDIIVLIFVMSALHPNEWARAVSNIYKMLKPGGVVVLRDYGRHDLTQLRFKGGRLLDDNFYIRGDKTRVYFFELDDLAVMFTGSPAHPKHRIIPSPQVMYDDEDDREAAPTDASAPVNASPSSLHMPSGGTPRASTPSTLEHAASSGTVSPSLVGTEEISAEQSASPAGSSHLIESSSAPSSQKGSEAHPAALRQPPDCPPHPLFAIKQLGVDRRLLVNRKRQLKMYRVWMQGKFTKLPLELPVKDIQ